MTKTLRLAAYLRDSGGDRQEKSTERQLQEIQEWATKRGVVISTVYRDEARPGSSVVGREAFQEMIRFFRGSDCDLNGLVVWSWSRFARDLDDAQFYRADLRRRGYELYSVVDPIPDGPIGRLLEAVIDWKNMQFLEDLSKDIRSGLRNLVLAYGAVPGTPPRGFMREPVIIGRHRDGRQHVVHRWVPDPDLVPLVRRAFEMRAAGEPIRKIQAATGLYKNVNSWKTFWANRIYIGVLEFGDLVIENYCEPIVDLETWQAVQAVQAKYAGRVKDGGPAHPRRAPSEYILSGLVRCARCGSALSGLTRRGHRNYACSRQRRRGDCDLKPIPAIILEKAILDELRRVLETPEVLAAEQDRLRERHSGDRDRLKDELKAQKLRLSENRRSIGRITDAIAEAGHSRAMLAKLSELEGEEGDLLAEIAKIERQLSGDGLSLSEKDLAELAAANRRALETATTEQLHTIVHGLIAAITVDRHERTVSGWVEIYLPPPGIKKKAKACL